MQLLFSLVYLEAFPLEIIPIQSMFSAMRYILLSSTQLDLCIPSNDIYIGCHVVQAVCLLPLHPLCKAAIFMFLRCPEILN